MPDTAVGSANGKSIMASITFLPGIVYRTSDHATRKPKKALISAAMSEVAIVSLYDATTRGVHALAQNPSQPRLALLITSAESGISTMRLR
jgi:hypothetical protein